MTLDMIIEEEKIKAKEEGFNDAKLKTAVATINRFNLPIEKVAETCGIDVETLRRALQEEQ